MSEQHHEEAHTGPIKKPKQLLLAVFFSFVVPIFVIIGLVKFVTSSDTTGAGTANAEMAKAMRLQKVGTVEIRDANRPLRGGAEVFKSQCAACHETGVAGAPKFQDAAAWGPRIKQSLETLVHSALTGKGAMAAQGGGEFNDTEIARGVVYMANAAGANFPEPQPAAGAAAGEAPAAATAACRLWPMTLAFTIFPMSVMLSTLPGTRSSRSSAIPKNASNACAVSRFVTRCKSCISGMCRIPVPVLP